MKLSQYDANVNRNITQAKVAPAGDLASFGADTKGTQAFIGALNAAGEEYRKEWLKDQNDRVIDASNEYNQRIDALMNDENKGLYVQNQGRNAQNVQSLYEQEEKKIREDVMSKYGITSNYAVNAFGNESNKSVTGYLHDISLYQRKEADKYADTQNAGIWQNVVNTGLRNQAMAMSLMGDASRKSMAIYASRGIDPEAAEQKMYALRNNAAANMLESQMVTGDYTRGQNFLAYYKTLPGADMTTIKKFENDFAVGKMKLDTERDVDKDIDDNHINLTKMTGDQFSDEYMKNHPLSFSGMTSVSGFAAMDSTYNSDDDAYASAKEKYHLTDDDIRNLKAMRMQESSWDNSASNGDHVGPYEFDTPTWASTASGKNNLDRHDAAASIDAAAELYAKRKAKGGVEYAIRAHNTGEGGTDSEAGDDYISRVKAWKTKMFGFEDSTNAGNTVVNQAVNGYGEGDHWKGNVTKDDSIQCDSWTADVYKKAGLNLDPDGNGVTQPQDFGAAFHYDVDNYELKPGDWLDGNFHVGIYLGDGKVRARNSSDGVTTMTLEQFEGLTDSNGDTNGLIGVGSVSEFAQSNGYSGGELSDDQRDMLNQQYRDKVMAAYQRKKTEQLEYIRNAISGIQQNLETMSADGKDIDSQIGYVHSQIDGDYLLKDSDQATAILGKLRMAKEAEARKQLIGGSIVGGRPSKAGSGMMTALIANIQSGDITTEGELQQVISRTGAAVSADQYNKLVTTLQDTQNGKDIEMNVDKSSVESGLNGMSISDGDFKIAKTIARRMCVQWSQEHNGMEPNDWQKRDFVIQALTNNISIGGSSYSDVEERKSNIANVFDTDDPDYKTVVFTDNNSYDVYVGDVQALLDGTKTEADIQFTREGGMM